MSLKINFKKMLYELCMLMPIIYTAFSCISPSLANKAIIFELISVYYIINVEYIKKKKKINFFFLNVLTSIYILYTVIKCNFQAIIHINFYSYLLMFYMFWLFLEKDIRTSFINYFLKKKKFVYIYFVIFWIIVIYSCLSLNGLVKEGNMLVLYGPFRVPHMLAYILLVFYCAFSIIDMKNKYKIVSALKILCFLGIILTAVRSATIAIIVLIMYDFITLKGVNKKIIILTCIGIAFIFLYMETDILTNNPIVNKTIRASNNGSISNGREKFRNIVLEDYKKRNNIIEKTMGITVNGVIEVIYNSIGVKIHAHNDYANIIAGYGIIGFLLIIATQYKIGKVCKNKVGFIFLELFIFILAFYNGFAMYVMLTASFPIILCFFEEKSKLLVKSDIKRGCGEK